MDRNTLGGKNNAQQTGMTSVKTDEYIANPQGTNQEHPSRMWLPNIHKRLILRVTVRA